jgi:hypothetical protein
MCARVSDYRSARQQPVGLSASHPATAGCGFLRKPAASSARQSPPGSAGIDAGIEFQRPGATGPGSPLELSYKRPGDDDERDSLKLVEQSMSCNSRRPRMRLRGGTASRFSRHPFRLFIPPRKLFFRKVLIRAVWVLCDYVRASCA